MSPEECGNAVRELFQSSYSSMVAYAFRLGGRLDIAEEAVQEAFFALYRNLRRGTVPERKQAWMLTVVRREVQHRLRTELRQPPVVEEADSLRAAEWPAHAPLPESIRRSDLWRLLAVLTAREEEAILLRLASLKYSEIAEQMGISPKTVSALLTTALRKLQQAAKRTRSEEQFADREKNVHPRTLQ